MVQSAALAKVYREFLLGLIGVGFGVIGVVPVVEAAEVDLLQADKAKASLHQQDLGTPLTRDDGVGRGDLRSQATPNSPDLAPDSAAASVSITAVELKPTPEGLDVRLLTFNNEKLISKTSEQGKNLLIEVSNARLQLPDGKAFRQDQPSPGIESVSVVQASENSVLITIVGIDDVPDSVVLSEQPGLAINLTAAKAEAEEELVVTAQKREERPRDVPISLSVFERKAIEDAQIDNINDLAARTPNFKVSPSTSGRLFTNYSLRGLNNANFLSPKDVVGFYVDDVSYEFGSFIDFDLIDIERIEVLRGPQSTLYGRNSQAGVVNIQTRKPSNKPEFNLSASYSSFDTKNIGISYSDALIPDKLKFRIVGNYRQTDGFTRNTLLNTNAGEQLEGTVRGELLWTPSKAWEISFKAGGSFIEDGDTVFALANAANPYEVQYNTDGSIKVNTTNQSLKVSHKGKDFDFTSITTHRQSSQSQLNADVDYTSVDIFSSNFRYNANVWSQEFRFQSPKRAEKFRWIAGTYLESNQFKINGENFVIIGSGTDSIFSEVNSKTFALFGQIDYQPIPDLTLTAGLRYEYNANTIDRTRTFTPEGSFIPVPSGLTVQGAETSSNVFLPKFAVNYRVNNNLSVYGSIARGYKPGGFNYRADSLDFLVFKPELSWNYEVGLKSSFLDDRISANLSLFSTDLQNYQAPLAGPDGFFREITNAEVGIKGLELEVSARPVKGLQLDASLGLLDGEFKSYRNPFTGADFSGNRLNFAPNLTYNLGVQYRSPQGIFGRIEVQGFGTTYFDDANTLKQVPYALVNVRLGYEAKNYGIYVFGNNIFDTEYVNSAFIFPPPNVIGSFGSRATVGVQVKFKF